MKIKNCPDYLFSDNLIVNSNDCGSNLLEINKLSFRGVFTVSIRYIKYFPTNRPNLLSTDRNDKDEDFLYFFLDDLDGYIEKNNEIKYLVFDSTDKNKEALKATKNFGKKLKDTLK